VVATASSGQGKKCPDSPPSCDKGEDECPAAPIDCSGKWEPSECLADCTERTYKLERRAENGGVATCPKNGEKKICKQGEGQCPPLCGAMDKAAIEGRACRCAEDDVELCGVGMFCWSDNTCNFETRVAQVFVMELETSLEGVEPDAFNTNPDMVKSFKSTVARLLVGVETDDIYDVVARVRNFRSFCPILFILLTFDTNT
jgi:hypothetical protein